MKRHLIVFYIQNFFNSSLTLCFRILPIFSPSLISYHKIIFFVNHYFIALTLLLNSGIIVSTFFKKEQYYEKKTQPTHLLYFYSFIYVNLVNVMFGADLGCFLSF